MTAVSLYGGAIEAHQIGVFIMCGETFRIIRPGYNAQGQRKNTWTQIVHEDIPVYETKIKADVARAMALFQGNWKKTIGDDRELMRKALAACKASRRRQFGDGSAGVQPAQSLTRDGRGRGKRYQK